MRQAEIVKQPKEQTRKALRSKRAHIGRQTVGRFVERLVETADRLRQGPEAAELYCAAAELYEGTIENKPHKATELYGKALDAFALSRPAHLGLRRLARKNGDVKSTAAALQREIQNATGRRARALKMELARTLLYLADKPGESLAILEELEAERIAALEARKEAEPADVIENMGAVEDDGRNTDVKAELPDGSGEEAKAEELEEIPTWMGLASFFMWEECLWATAQWRRYEELLREALAQQHDNSGVTQLIERRLLQLYQYIAPDERQAELIIDHLVDHSDLDPELVELALRKLEKDDNHDEMVELLTRALTEEQCLEQETTYRMLLADIAHHHFEDVDHAADIVSAGLDNHPQEAILIDELLSLQEERGDVAGIVDALTASLEVVEDKRQRADILFRIGTILDEELELDDAAEEVFVEANREFAAHRPTLRALGRIFAQRSDWRGLAGLYERELKDERVLAEKDVWRKHFKLAELYEEKLHDADRAWDQYGLVLDSQPAWLPALKGASRTAAQLGHWSKLLERYAAAEAETHDQRQRVYLLERIAQIAEEHLEDLQTACTALEGLRIIEPRHPGALTSLARLYSRLGRYPELVDLTDEELEYTEDWATAASLLTRNGEICEEQIGDKGLAEKYYRKALARVPTFQPALEGLARLLAKQERWDDLVEMGMAEIAAWGDSSLALQRMHSVADILEKRLGNIDKALELYERCVEMDPRDRLARQNLVRIFRARGEWTRVCEVLELEAEHASSSPGATLFRLGQIREHRLADLNGALDAYRRAFLSDPGSPVLMRAWLSLARKLDKLEGPRKILTAASGKPANPASRAEVLTALAEFSLLETGDPLTAAGFLEIVHQLKPERKSVAALLAMAFARSGRWNERIAMTFEDSAVQPEREHGFEASLVSGVPDEFQEDTHDVLNSLESDEFEMVRVWSQLAPVDRPRFRKLPRVVRKSDEPEAQDLRRWATIRALQGGDLAEPSRVLLPQNNEHNLTLRPDMELLASHYDVSKAWGKLLEVLFAQEEMAPTNNERITLALERANILLEIDKEREALNVVRNAFEHCGFFDPVREELYTWLEEQGDWEHVVSEMRRHLMHIEDPAEQAVLWKRLSRALEHGIGDLDEALRALDAAYRTYPADGSMLKEISRVAEQLDEVQIARRAMDDYLQFHQPPIEAELDVARRFVELHIDYPGGDPKFVLSWLDDLAQRSCEDRRALDALADAHAKAGNPMVACETILRLVKLPYQKEQLELWLRLAHLYAGPLADWEAPSSTGSRARGFEQAAGLFWELLGNFPENPEDNEIFAAIEDFYRGPDARVQMAERLRDFIDAGKEIGFESELLREYLGILGRVVGDELGDWKAAREIYAEAIDMAAVVPNRGNGSVRISGAPKNGHGGSVNGNHLLKAKAVGADDLSRKHAYAMCKIPGQRKQALRSFSDLIIEDPFQHDIINAALELCESAQAWDRARIIRQVAACFIPEARLHAVDEGVRHKIDVTRELDEKVLEQRLLAESLRDTYDVLHEALPIIESVHKDDIPSLSAVGGKKLRGRTDISDLFNDIADKLGLGSVRIYLGNDESPVPMVFSSPSAFWIPNDRWDAMEDDERRHWAGYAAGLLWTGLSPLLYLDGRVVWQLLDGIKYSATGDGINGRTAYTIEAAEKVKSPWYRRARKEVARLLDEAGDAVNAEHAEEWGALLKTTGDRAGLLFSGDVNISISAMLAGEGWRSGSESNTGISRSVLESQLERNPRVRELLGFALSEDYLHLRYAAGLAQKPSRIIG